MATTKWLRARALIAALLENTSGIAAIEFAMILPILLVLFFGTVEMSNGVAVYRKVTMMAHTLSDLTSQSQEVQDTDLTNFFAASTGVMLPYSATLHFDSQTPTDRPAMADADRVSSRGSGRHHGVHRVSPAVPAACYSKSDARSA